MEVNVDHGCLARVWRSSVVLQSVLQSLLSEVFNHYGRKSLRE